MRQPEQPAPIPGLDEHRSIMQGLMDLHGPIRTLIGEREIYYLDIPVHENIGDLLIYLGALTFFRKIGIEPTYIAPCYGRMPNIPRNAVIVLHGGGNFGDIYPDHQIFREEIIERHKQNRIIVLPQTIHFTKNYSFSRAQRVIEAHPDVHLFVRDEHSMRFACRIAERVSMMPDMAHQLYPLARPAHTSSPTGASTLNLFRTDIESSSRLYGHPLAVTGGHLIECMDWNAIVPSRVRWARKLLSLPVKLCVPGSRLLLLSWWQPTMQKLAAEAIRTFARHEAIHTDRLHGHILAGLMNLPSVVYDNSYGKISAYIHAWTGRSPLTHFETEESR